MPITGPSPFVGGLAQAVVAPVRVRPTSTPLLPGKGAENPAARRLEPPASRAAASAAAAALAAASELAQARVARQAGSGGQASRRPAAPFLAQLLAQDSAQRDGSAETARRLITQQVSGEGRRDDGAAEERSLNFAELRRPARSSDSVEAYKKNAANFREFVALRTDISRDVDGIFVFQSRSLDIVV